MERAAADEKHANDGCMWGCLTLTILGAALLVFGLEVAGKACLVMAPASLLGQGLRTGHFGWAPSRAELRREANPRLFWATAAALAALTALSLIAFVGEVRRF